MVNISRKDLEIIAVALGGIDFYMEGALSTPVARALKSAVSKARPVATRGAMAGLSAAARSLPRVAGTAGVIAMRHPYVAAGALIYVAATNREQVADLVRQGYDVVQDSGIGSNIDTGRFMPAIQDKFSEGIRPIGGLGFPKNKPRRKSKYNINVSKGLKALKNSTSYGKKGIINAPKKAFGFVARTVSKLMRGNKVPSKGASGIVKRSLPGIKKITVSKK